MKVTITNDSLVPAVFEHGVKSPSLVMPGESIQLDLSAVAPVIVRAPENLDELLKEATDKAEALAAKEAEEQAKAEEAAKAAEEQTKLDAANKSDKKAAKAKQNTTEAADGAPNNPQESDMQQDPADSAHGDSEQAGTESAAIDSAATE